MKGLKLTPRGEAVRDYLEAAATLACIAVTLYSFFALATLIGL